MRCSLPACSAGLLCALFAQSARAQPAVEPQAELPGLLLSWQAPAGCRDRDAVLARIAELLGRPPEAGMSHAIEANVTIARHEDGYRLELFTRYTNQDGRRMLVAKTCDEVTDTAALVLAVLMNPALRHSVSSGLDAPASARQASSPEGTGANPVPLPPALPPAAAGSQRDQAPSFEPRRPALGARPAWSASMRAGPVLAVGLVPGASIGLQVGGAARRSDIELSGALVGVVPRDATVEGDDRGATVGYLGLSLGISRSIWRGTAARLDFGVAGNAGLVAASPYGPGALPPGMGGWVGVGPSAMVEHRLAPGAAMFLAGQPSVTLARSRFVWGGKSVFQSEIVAVLVTAGVSLGPSNF